MVATRFFALASAATLAVAQSQTQYQINPDDVDSNLRQFWCDQQLSTCPLICQDQENGADAVVNDCDPDNFYFQCTCDNGEEPNLDEYSQTMPYFLCTEWVSNCAAGCGSDNSCVSSCTQDHPCGAQNPTTANTTTSATTSAATTTSTSNPDDDTDEEGCSSDGICTGTPGSSNNDNSNNDNDNNDSGAASVMGHTYTFAAVFGSLFVGFAML
jgi:hypothetical protein